MTADTLTAEERAEARLVNRLRKASKVVCPSALHAQLHAEAADAIEAVERERDEYRKTFEFTCIERDTALDRLAEVERERDDLTVLVRRLLAPTQNAKCREQAEDYLRRHGLNGSTLRGGK